MGLFLSMSAVVGGTPSEIESALSDFVTERKGTFSRATGQLPESEHAWQLQSNAGTTFVYPNGFLDWDAASARLSQRLSKPVFSFHIHDSDFWTFVLFVHGVEFAQFNPIPDYWNEQPVEERTRWLPKASDIAACVPGISPEKIAPYLREWPDDDSLMGRKAHPDDEFEYGVDWQVADFMRHLGFKYPEPDEGTSYRFKIKDR